MGGNFLTALGPNNDSSPSSPFADAADKKINPDKPVFIEPGDVLPGPGRLNQSDEVAPPTLEELRGVAKCAAELDGYGGSLANDIRPFGRAA